MSGYGNVLILLKKKSQKETIPSRHGLLNTALRSYPAPEGHIFYALQKKLNHCNKPLSLPATRLGSLAKERTERMCLVRYDEGIELEGQQLRGGQ